MLTLDGIFILVTLEILGPHLQPLICRQLSSSLHLGDVCAPIFIELQKVKKYDGVMFIFTMQCDTLHTDVFKRLPFQVFNSLLLCKCLCCTLPSMDDLK